MRRAILVLLVSPLLAAPPQFDEGRFYSFVAKVAQFDRLYRGCGAKGWPPDLVCSSGDARFDAKLWSQISREGKELFR